jgi:BlaI family transcriptional regulator, penicillinase repressor
MSHPSRLPPRERQIMEIVYAKGKASVNDVLADMPDPPTRTSVRTILSLLEQKGHLTHIQAGREFVYKPVVPKTQVGRSALKSVLRAFFADSLPKALAAYLADPKTKLSAEEAHELQHLIAQAKKRGD